MEDDCKNQGAGFSSFTADLFGSKESPPQSSSTGGGFASIFPPPSTVLRKKSSGADQVIGSWSKLNSAHQYHAWSSKQWTPAVQRDPAHCNTPNEEKNQIFQERAEPCNLSSSLYYGGQDNYTRTTPTTEAAGTHPTFRTDDEAKDNDNGSNSHRASRGNWWQGSLYY